MNARPGMAGHWKSGISAAEILLYFLLLLAMLLGGGPSDANWRIAAICVAASALAAVAMPWGGWPAFLKLSLLARMGVGLIPLIPLIQLIPLPPGLWEGLPGRAVSQAIFGLVGTEQDWHPLSVTPRNTLFALLMLLPPFAAFFAALTLDSRAKERCIGVFIAIAALSILVGLVQLASRGATFDFYGGAHRGNLLGFFPNRNHQGVMIAMAACCSIAFVHRKVRQRQAAMAWSAILSVTFLVAAVGTTSRAGLGLTVFALAVVNYIYFMRDITRQRPMLLVAIIVAAVLMIYFFSFSDVVARSLARFNSVGDDGRWTIWRAITPLISQYFPWGSGIGSFVPAYAAIEQLNSVTPSYLNRAHNEYLELLIEAGIPGLIALGLFITALGARAFALLRGKVPVPVFAPAATLAILLVGLHSIVDYPLRTQAIMVLFAILLALFFSGNSKAEQRPRATDGADA